MITKKTKETFKLHIESQNTTFPIISWLHCTVVFWNLWRLYRWNLIQTFYYWIFNLYNSHAYLPDVGCCLLLVMVGPSIWTAWQVSASDDESAERERYKRFFSLGLHCFNNQHSFILNCGLWHVCRGLVLWKLDALKNKCISLCNNIQETVQLVCEWGLRFMIEGRRII